MSIATAQAAEARQRAAATPGYYNLQAGPTLWRFSTRLGAAYNDNVQYTEHGEADVIFRPELDAEMRWPITEKNSLNLALGAGYSAYVNHSSLSRFYITPGSELAFDLFVRNLWINLHDRFSLTQDSYQDPTVANTGDLSRLENAVGLSLVWDLNKVLVRAGYDHVNYVSLTTNPNERDGDADVFSGSAGYVLKAGMLLGVQLGGSLFRYWGTNASSGSQWNAGLLYDAQLSEYIRFQASAGYTVYAPASGRTTVATGDYPGYYAQLALTHRLNRYVDYSLSGGRTITFAFYGGTVDLYTAQWLASWKIFRKTTVNTSLSFESGTQLDFGREEFQRFGPGISFGRALTSKLAGGLGYQFQWRESDQPGRSYAANIVDASLAYRF